MHALSVRLKIAYKHITSKCNFCLNMKQEIMYNCVGQPTIKKIYEATKLKVLPV